MTGHYNVGGVGRARTVRQQEASYQEVTARYPEEDVRELSHSAERLPQNDNYVEDEPSHHSSWQHESLSSQSSLPIFSIFFPSPRSEGGGG